MSGSPLQPPSCPGPRGHHWTEIHIVISAIPASRDATVEQHGDGGKDHGDYTKHQGGHAHSKQGRRGDSTDIESFTYSIHVCVILVANVDRCLMETLNIHVLVLLIQ